MKTFPDLTAVGKLRRLRTLAVSALAHYDLHTSELTYHSFDTNLLYRVTTDSGERFMLRLAAPGWRTLGDLQSEAQWLNALARDTDVSAPRVIPARTGEDVLSIDLPGIPIPWNATLMTWIPGRLLGHYLTPHNLEKMGELFTTLHHHGASWRPPDGFTTRRFEHWVSRGEQNLIVAHSQAAIPAALPECIATLPSRTRELLGRMHQHVEQAYAAIDRSDLRVIHCDLWHDNIKLHCGRLYPFDFEDTVWGFRAHDIAMAMLDLLEATDELRYRDLLAAFRHGYEAQMAWPDDPIEPFQIGRLLWKVNWIACHQPQWLAKMVERHLPVFEHYAQTRQVIQPLGR